MRNALLCVLALVEALAPLAVRAEDWLRAQVPGFIVYSQGDPAALERMATDLERYDAALHAELGVPEGPPGAPLSIYLFKDPEAVARLLSRDHVAGFYAPRIDGSLILAHRLESNKDGPSARETVFHEYAHHFLYRHIAAPWPAWYREGYADYLSTLAFLHDGRWVAGRPALFRLGTARRQRVPLLTLLEEDDSAYPEGKERRFYANAWLLVHLLRNDPLLGRRLDAYLDALARGEPHDVALLQFGNVSLLEQRMNDHAASSFVERTSREALPAPAPVKVEALNAASSRLLELTLALQFGKDRPGALADLAKLAGEYPDRADIAYRYAVALAQDGSPDAEGQADRVLALDPQMPRALVMKAELVRKRRGPRKDVEAWMAAAARLAPDDPLVQLAWYQTRVKAGRDATREAFPVIEHAYRLASEVSTLRLTYALALGNSGQLKEAEDLLVRLAGEPEGSGRAKAALARLRALRLAREQAPAAKAN
jgi:tetratricopeptide (TPR) repeat protein